MHYLFRAEGSELSTTAADCFICRKHRGETAFSHLEKIAENDLALLYHAPLEKQPEPSIYLGHLIVESRRHTTGWDQLTEKEAAAIGQMISRAARALKSLVQAEHIYVFGIGHNVPHLHVHVIPRYPGTPQEYWGIRVTEWDTAPRGGINEVDHLCRKLRQFFDTATPTSPPP
jgi:histidine triad (HIT) family protein